jgi:hypothetical protein
MQIGIKKRVVVSRGFMAKKKKEIGQALPGPGMLRVGDVVAIPLGNDGYGYGRRHKNAAIGIINLRSMDLLELGEVSKSEILFSVGYCEPIDHPDWIYLGKWRFDSEDESWGPATYIRSEVNPSRIQILHRGQVKDATKQDIHGLSKCKLYSPKSIREMVLEKVVGVTSSVSSQEVIEAVASCENGCFENTPCSEVVLPFLLVDEQGEFRLIFNDWDWLHEQLGGETFDEYSFNGYGMEGLIKAVRLMNHLSVESSNIEYNSSGDYCLIIFPDVRDAERSALLTIDVIKDGKKLIETIGVARKNGFDEG